MLDAYDTWRSWADPKVCCDYGLHVGITWWSKSVSEEVGILCKELGVNSFKTFMAYKGLYQLNDSDLLDVFERIRSLNAVAMVKYHIKYKYITLLKPSGRCMLKMEIS